MATVPIQGRFTFQDQGSRRYQDLVTSLHWSEIEATSESLKFYRDSRDISSLGTIIQLSLLNSLNCGQKVCHTLHCRSLQTCDWRLCVSHGLFQYPLCHYPQRETVPEGGPPGRMISNEQTKTLCRLEQKVLVAPVPVFLWISGQAFSFSRQVM